MDNVKEFCISLTGVPEKVESTAEITFKNIMAEIFFCVDLKRTANIQEAQQNSNNISRKIILRHIIINSLKINYKEKNLRAAILRKRKDVVCKQTKT